MPAVEISEEQVVNLVRQLSPQRKREAVLALAGTAAEREERLKYAESRLRGVAEERGVRWDAMSDEEREDFVDHLVHEDRRCQT